MPTALPAQHEALQGQIKKAADILRKGGVIAVPTDTLYGLAASTSSESAVRRIFRLKGRSAGAAMPVLIDTADRVEQCAVSVPDAARALMRSFWPGALTIVLRRSHQIPSIVSGGLDTVALRVPDHHVPRALVRELDAPITGTSANRTGHEGLTTEAAVRRVFGRDIDLVVDGQAGAGLPSTVVDLTRPEPSVLRVGALSVSDIEAVLGIALASHG